LLVKTATSGDRLPTTPREGPRLEPTPSLPNSASPPPRGK
jgi:hypothetical protein